MLISEEYGDVVLVYIYDENGSPIGFKYRSKSRAEDTFDSYLYQKNLQGDIVGIYNTSGTQVARYIYDAWGNILSSSGSMASINPFRYRGYYFDQETNFYYLQSRYYDPAIGRFISADATNLLLTTPSELTDTNLYAYCDNNPIIRADDDGECWEAIFIGFVAGIVGQYIGDVVGNIASGKTGFDIFAPTSSFRDYMASGFGSAVASIPGLGFIGTVTVGAIGSVVTDGIKGDINSFEDLKQSLINGSIANALGFAVSKGMAEWKLDNISNMSRFDKKKYLRDVFYGNTQADVNVNLKTFANSPKFVNLRILETRLFVFRAGIYSTTTSTLAALLRG